MLIFLYFFFILVLIFLILVSFFLASKKVNWENQASSEFECGFTSYFFSRYSFSMHFFLVGLIFLFLDLELCFVMPFFLEDFPSINSFLCASIFILVLILSILYEWSKGLLEWKF